MTATYRDVKADILDKITQGIWPPGSMIPNEVDLAAGYGCARATVNRAVRELADDGIVERRRKAGTRVRMAPLRQARFVIPIVRKEIEDQGATYRYALLDRGVVTAPDWLMARLDLDEGAQVLHLRCRHLADEVSYQYEDRWINLAVLPDAANATFDVEGPNEWLVAAVPFSNAEISFQAVEADAELSRQLGCAPGTALFQTERSTWWEGRAITFVRLTFRQGHSVTTRY